MKTKIITCYIKTIGDSVSYKAQIESLMKARDHIRIIIKKFIEATSQIEQTIKPQLVTP
jgi:hypothetical protein